MPCGPGLRSEKPNDAHIGMTRNSPAHVHSQDLGTECANPYTTRFCVERLLLYDKHRGGMGLAVQVRRAVCSRPGCSCDDRPAASAC